MQSVRSMAIVRADLVPSLIIAPDEIPRCQRRLPKLMRVPNEIVRESPKICGYGPDAPSRAVWLRVSVAGQSLTICTCDRV
jgi:hypothetical protein